MQFKPTNNSFKSYNRTNTYQKSRCIFSIVNTTKAIAQVEVIAYNEKSLLFGTPVLFPFIPSILMPRKSFWAFGLGPNGHWDNFSFNINVTTESDNITEFNDSTMQLLLNDSLILNFNMVSRFNSSALLFQFETLNAKKIKKVQIISSNKYLKKIFDNMVFLKKKKLHYRAMFVFN